MIRDQIKLPKMWMVEQKFTDLPEIDVFSAMDLEWQQLRGNLDLQPGAKIAVAVGSRGIAKLDEIVKNVVDKLKDSGCRPFIVPAMGSHGGATSEGQTSVLESKGVTEARIGVPIRATMDVKSFGEVNGIPLFLDRYAAEADGIVLINRVKPHTNFIGPTESGLLKLMAIGLGNQIGAEHYHRLSVVRSQYEIISSAGRELLKRVPVLFGVGLVENQKHEIAIIKMAPADQIEMEEAELLIKARACMATLPLEEIDLLIIDEMGKDISGECIDPNVVGRDVVAYGAERLRPKITRIFVRDLTDASEGSAVGIGQADFTLKRLVDKIDFKATAVNCLTSCCPEAGKVPLTYDNDYEAIAAALVSLRPYELTDVRIVHIKNTLELVNLKVSQGCLHELKDNANVDISEDETDLHFDDSGMLFSSFVTF
ncbi:MAG: lactate racemase domain-containing protein [Desulfobacterales bacterium]|jgi:hypothetical protein